MKVAIMQIHHDTLHYQHQKCTSINYCGMLEPCKTIYFFMKMTQSAYLFSAGFMDNIISCSNEMQNLIQEFIVKNINWDMSKGIMSCMICACLRFHKHILIWVCGSRRMTDEIKVSQSGTYNIVIVDLRLILGVLKNTYIKSQHP